jgi:thymidine kinase
MATKTNSARDVLLTLCNRNIDLRNCVICIDEVQFYDEEIIIVAETLRLEGAHVVCCGLDMDYRGESFAFAKIENARYLKALELLKAAGLADMIKSPMSIGHLMAISNHVVKLSARTFEGDEATHTMKTSIASEAIVEIGDNDIYKPVPASCNPQVMERVQKFKLLLDL